jgi:hypothetical protein
MAEWNVTPCEGVSFSNGGIMRKLIVTATAGLLLIISAASVDAARRYQPRLIEGRAAHVTPVPPVLYRFNDFGPDYGTTIPFTRKAG